VIQLSVISQKAINSSSKSATKEGEANTTFNDLLKQTSAEQEEGVLIGPFIQPVPNLLMVKPPIEGSSPAVAEESGLENDPTQVDGIALQPSNPEREALVDPLVMFGNQQPSLKRGYDSKAIKEIVLEGANPKQSHQGEIVNGNILKDISLNYQSEIIDGNGFKSTIQIQGLQGKAADETGSSPSQNIQVEEVLRDSQSKLDVQTKMMDGNVLKENISKMTLQPEVISTVELQQNEPSIQQRDRESRFVMIPNIHNEVLEEGNLNPNKMVVSNLLQKEPLPLEGIMPKIFPVERKQTATLILEPNMELQDVNQATAENQPVVGFGPIDRSPSLQLTQPTMVSANIQANAVPVQLSHFEKDVTYALQNAIKTKDGMEAIFSLQPHELGKVDVKVIIKDGMVTAEFFATTNAGKDILETNVQILRTALEQQGFQVDKIDISQQNTNFSSPFSQKGDSQPRHGQQESKKRNHLAGYHQEDEIREYAADDSWVSKINTTA
jgi:hypothetical protein